MIISNETLIGIYFSIIPSFLFCLIGVHFGNEGRVKKEQIYAYSLVAILTALATLILRFFDTFIRIMSIFYAILQDIFHWLQFPFNGFPSDALFEISDYDIKEIVVDFFSKYANCFYLFLFISLPTWYIFIIKIIIFSLENRIFTALGQAIMCFVVFVLMLIENIVIHYLLSFISSVFYTDILVATTFLSLFMHIILLKKFYRFLINRL